MKQIITLLFLTVFSLAVVNAQQKVVINTMTGKMMPAETMISTDLLKEQSAYSNGIAPQDIIPTGPSIPQALLNPEASMYVQYSTLTDTSDSAMTYPPNIKDYKTELWTFTGIYDYPLNLGTSGAAFGFGQFQPPLDGKLTIDTMIFFLYKISVWPNLSDHFYLAPISLPNENMTDTMRWGGFKFDFNQTNYDVLTKDQNWITLHKDTINTRLYEYTPGQYRIRPFILPMKNPIILDKGKNMGLIFFSATSSTTNFRDTVRMQGGFEWGLPRKNTYGVMMRRVGTDYDTVESLFRWYRTWQSPEAQQKFRLLHGASIKQNFNIWIFGYYDGNLNVKQLSPDAGELSLSKNYPNPVVNTATINFAVTQPGKVTIILYNSLGQAVKTLANYHYQPGTYTSELDASELPVGTYIYTMTTGSFSTSKTLNIIR